MVNLNLTLKKRNSGMREAVQLSYIQPLFSTTCRTSNYIDPEGRQGPDYSIRQTQEVSVVLFRPADV